MYLVGLSNWYSLTASIHAPLNPSSLILPFCGALGHLFMWSLKHPQSDSSCEDVPQVPFLNQMLPSSQQASHSSVAASDECLMWLRVNQVHIETLPWAFPSITAVPGSCQGIFADPLPLAYVRLCHNNIRPTSFAPITEAAHAVTYFPPDAPRQYIQHALHSPASLQPLTYSLQTREKPLGWQTPDFIKRRRRKDGQPEVYDSAA